MNVFTPVETVYACSVFKVISKMGEGSVGDGNRRPRGVAWG